VDENTVEKKTETEHHQDAPAGVPLIHRVCIQCNNMFTVAATNFDAKQCPACHKG
jgi:hypothetical protein